MAEYWAGIYRFITANEQHIAEEIGDDTEDYVEYMLRKEDTITIAGLTNRLPSRTITLPWLLEVRHSVIYYIVWIGGCFGAKKITVYTAMGYVDRFLSLVSQKPNFELSRLLGIACLHLACEQFQETECLRLISRSAPDEFLERLMIMKASVVTQFRGIVTLVTPIHFIKYFLSKFCKDLSRKEYARIKTVEIIMSTLGDVRLMSLKAFSVGAAATLLASNAKVLTRELIKDEMINALPQKWIIPLDEVYSCYNRLLEINRHRLDIRSRL
ncbi:cyclin-D5-1-like [Solanum dulcamara]|uniref:cyclin-D5-1-like n=1 Tax=Solanum dulcamara TaxID=45834 RepID=UPI0024856FC8|nr:cyclin-D5-1-like [Solanum dulcamara]